MNDFTLDTLPDWMGQAACASIKNADYFFPKPGQSRQADAAKKVCADCPVRLRCLDWALKHEAKTRNHLHGVYGGLGTAERAELLKNGSAA